MKNKQETVKDIIKQKGYFICRCVYLDPAWGDGVEFQDISF